MSNPSSCFYFRGANSIGELARQAELFSRDIYDRVLRNIDGANVHDSFIDTTCGLAWDRRPNQPKKLCVPLLSTKNAPAVREKDGVGLELVVDADNSTSGRVCVRDKDDTQQIISLVPDDPEDGTSGGSIDFPAGIGAIRTTGNFNLRLSRNSVLKLDIGNTYMEAQDDFQPNADGTIDLGASGTAWRETYTRTIDSGGVTDLTLQRNNVTKLTLGDTLATATTTVQPNADGTLNSGASGTAWAETFTRTVDSGSANDLTLQRNNTTKLTLGDTAATVTTDVKPNAANTLDLGASGTRFAELHIDRIYESAAATSTRPKGYIEGLRCRRTSTSQIVVETGSCRDGADATNLVLSSEATVSRGTLAAFNATHGLDTTTPDGTVATNGTTAVAGSNTAFLTAFGTRALTGTIGTGGAASTTITGSSTKYLFEIKLDDLIGNATVGYARVTAIASDTSLTVNSNLTIANGSSGNVIENPTFKVNDTSEVRRVNAIASDTALTLTATAAADASSSYNVGHNLSSTWYYAWLVTNGTGTIAILSTQRTTPFLSGITAKRRIGAIFNNSSGDLVAGRHVTDGVNRFWTYEQNIYTAPLRILSGGTATAATAIECDEVVPIPNIIMQFVGLLWDTRPNPMDEKQTINFYIYQSSTTSTYMYADTQTGNDGYGTTVLLIFVENTYIKYSINADTNTPAYVDVVGYYEDLTR